MILKYKQVVIPINRLVSWNLTPKQFRNVKPYQVGTGTEKPYRVSTNLVLELKNRSKYRLMLVLEWKDSFSFVPPIPAGKKSEDVNFDNYWTRTLRDKIWETVCPVLVGLGLYFVKW